MLPSAAPPGAPSLEDERDRDVDAAWRGGELWWKLEPHQLEIYDAFCEWNERRQTPEYATAVIAADATLDDVWVEEIARRFGKTAKWIVMLTMIAIKRPGAVLTYATAYQKDIGEIIVPLANLVLSDGPDDLRPKYQSSKGESHEGLYFPNGSVIKLVGIDKHPDALRGRFSDGVVISEAGFVKGLEDTARAVLLPQFQRRPWAFLALESSTPKVPGHAFLEVFKPDAEKRGAYITRTLDANQAITDDERAKYIRQAGGRGHPTCEREYYCIVTRDPEIIVIPEFDEKVHVREHTRPPYAQCLTAADPGSTDLFGLVFGYYDFLAALGVIEWSWAKRNPSTRQVAAVIAFGEWMLWGKWPSLKLKQITLTRADGIDGWVELLADVATREQCEALREMANAQKAERPPETWPTLHPANYYTYWDGTRFVQNPAMRTTDVDKRLVRDLVIEYDIAFNVTPKPISVADDVSPERNNYRDAVASGHIVCLPTAGPVIAHHKNAIWNEKRTDFERHEHYGHYDCLAAAVYWWRNVQRNTNPLPPSHIGMNPEKQFLSPWRDQGKTPEQLAAERIMLPQKHGREGWRKRR